MAGDRPRVPKRHREKALLQDTRDRFAQNERAQRAAAWLLAGNTLVLCGPRGTGKTQFSACVIVLLQEIQLDSEDRWASAYEYWRLGELYGAEKQTWESDMGLDSPLESAKKCSLLVLDEATDAAVSRWGAQQLELLLDYRYGEVLPTILITNAKPAAFDASFGDSVADRLMEVGLIQQMDGENMRQRVGQAEMEAVFREHETNQLERRGF